MNQKSDEKDKERIAKVMARAGLCSRREAETWIAAGRVAVNGETLASPAFTVSPHDEIVVDGKPLPVRERTRLFLYHKPRGLVTTNRDEKDRKTVFDALPKNLPRVVSVGRLDLNSEGLLLLTNDGGLKRILELPETGWQRRYRVRANGRVTQEALDRLQNGITVEGIEYGPIKAVLDRAPGTNVWITMALREGKNREVRNVLQALDLAVNRLIRVSYGPFQLGELPIGKVEEIHSNILKAELGEKILRLSGADFSAPLRVREAEAEPRAPKKFFKPRPARPEFVARSDKRKDDRRERPGTRKSGASKFGRDKSRPRGPRR